MGHVGVGYNHGLAPLTYAGCGIAGLLLMIFAAEWLRKNEFTTIPDIFLRLYGENKFLHITATLMSIVVPFGLKWNLTAAKRPILTALCLFAKISCNSCTDKHDNDCTDNDESQTAGRNTF